MKIAGLIHSIITLTTFLIKIHAEPDPNFHIYLAFGQSNMEGQATITDKEKVVDSRFKMIATVDGCENRTLGEWYDAIPPLAHCNDKAGIMDYFGRKYVKAFPEEVRVGVAVVAVSGANILLFDKDKYQEFVDIYQFVWYQTIMDDYGRNPYGRLIEIGKKAQKEGVIKGIFLHQGENNISTEEWPDYVKIIYENILRDLDLKGEEVPLLVGEMVRTEMGGKAGPFNQIIDRVPEVIPNAYVISSEGLEVKKGDVVHFSNESFVTFGERFADKMISIINGNGDGGDNNSSSKLISYVSYNNILFGFLVILVITFIF